MRKLFEKSPWPQVVVQAAVLVGLGLAMDSASAGRPLTVDDANVNDAGAGHVEAWYAREAGPTKSWTIAPAYGITDGIEIAAALSRDTSNSVTATAVQAKFRLTESKKDGCNLGAVVGLAHANQGGGNSPYVNGIVTCNRDNYALHFNLGAVHPAGDSSIGTWGLAYEREFGHVTGHVEYFGEQHSKPTLQFGLRTELNKSLQVDGTVGRSYGETIFSLGLKFMF